MATSLPSNPSFMDTGKGKDEIYVATMPLRAAKGPPQLLMSAAYSLNLQELRHFMLIIKPSITPVSPLSNSQAIVFDFQPQDPENIYVALAALSGRAIPGIILERKMSKMPKRNYWYIGSSKLSSAVGAAYEFNSSWDTNLRIGQHDCRHYTNGGSILIQIAVGSLVKNQNVVHLKSNLIQDLTSSMQGLAEVLTGKKQVLERLKRNHRV